MHNLVLEIINFISRLDSFFIFIILFIFLDLLHIFFLNLVNKKDLNENLKDFFDIFFLLFYSILFLELLYFGNKISFLITISLGIFAFIVISNNFRDFKNKKRWRIIKRIMFYLMLIIIVALAIYL